jgi:anti-sigma B factor antagonist
MKAVVEAMSDVAVLVVPGDALTGNSVNSFLREAEAYTGEGVRLIVDLSEVQFIDSAGCAALMQLSKALEARGGALKVCGVTGTVRALFDLVRLQRVVDVVGDRATALAQLADHG